MSNQPPGTDADDSRMGSTGEYSAAERHRNVWRVMVTFVTLFLSLLTGTHDVQVAVDARVASVELLLDQKVIGRLTGPPWLLRCDFGDELRPHELVAVAYDEDGGELDRERQLVNLPRPQAETRVALVSGPSGRPNAVRVYWEAADAEEPLSVYAMLDGQVLHPTEDGLFPLPPHDPDEVHIVSAEVRFLDGLSARSDVTFGGRYGSRVATELTAVPIVLDGPPPTLAELREAFRVRGEVVAPAAIEKVGSRVYLVRDQAALAELRHVRITQDKVQPWHRLPTRGSGAEAAGREQDQLQFVVANPTQRRDRFLYPTSSGISLRDRSVAWLVTHLSDRQSAIRGQRPTDAVAVAGVQAAATGAPRAVVLVLSRDPRDASRYHSEDVQRYLHWLRVPLFVWSTAAAAPPGWADTRTIGSTKELWRAEEALFDELGRQWIVWLEGNHMINEVELVDTAGRFRLAGG